MRFIKSKLAGYLTDIFCCILLGSSICAVLLPAAGLKADFGECLLLTMAALALVVLFTRRWWVLPAVAAAAAALALLVTAITGTGDEFLAYIGGFFRWCAASYPDTEPYSQNGSIVAAKLAFALAPAAVSYLYFRKLFFFPLLPPAALALLIFLNYSRSEAFWPVFIMLLAVVFVAIAKTTGNRINRSLDEPDRISSALLATTAMALVPLIVFFAFAVAPKKDGEWQSKDLFHFVGDIADHFGWGESDPVQGSFTLGVSGFSPLESRLGGNVSLGNKKVMSVTTRFPVYLKGAVYNSYDGQRWYDSGALRSYRFSGAFWQDERANVFGAPEPSGKDAEELLKNMTCFAELDIYYSERGRTLFHTGQVKSLSSKKLDVSDVFFNGQSELFLHSPKHSLSYALNTVVFDRNADGFDANMLALEKLMQHAPDDSFEGIKSEYLQLPDALPDSVSDKASAITQGLATPYEKAKAIERWLTENCAYTLTPGAPPEGADFVGCFLQKREGYCVYFASAMTVLARACGLPARFVTGYALKRDPSTNALNAYIATSSTAHAWAEIYFRGIGWITFDPLIWNFDEMGVVDQSANTLVPTPAPSPEASAATGTKRDSQQAPMSDEAKITLIAIASVAAALALFAAARFILLLKGSNLYYKRLSRKYDTASGRVNACFARILRQAALLGIKMRNEDTISSFAARLDEYLGSGETARVCECVILMRFGFAEPDDDCVKALCAHIAVLEKQLRANLGLSGYLWRRVLLWR